MEQVAKGGEKSFAANGDIYDVIWISLSTLFLSFARYYIQKYVQVYCKNLVPDVNKLSESVWKAVIYGFLWVLSVYVVGMQDFFWDTKYCWVNWPTPPMTKIYKFWYFCQLGYYWSCFIFQRMGFDIKRKDENQMLVHHICTIILITCSYIYGYYLIGGVILFLNDFNDFILNFGKCFDYFGKKLVARMMFPVFAITWFTNRIYLGVTKILWSTMFETTVEIPDIPLAHLVIFNGMLVALAFLNLYWFYLIVKITIDVLFGTKNGPTDIREIPDKKNGEKKNGEKVDEKKDSEKKESEKKDVEKKEDKKEVDVEKKETEKN